MFNKINKYVIRKPTKLFVWISSIILYIVIWILFIVFIPSMYSNALYLITSTLSVSTLATINIGIFEIWAISFLILSCIWGVLLVYTVDFLFKKISVLTIVSDKSKSTYITILLWIFALYQIIWVLWFMVNYNIWPASPTFKLMKSSEIIKCYDTNSKLDFDKYKFTNVSSFSECLDIWIVDASTGGFLLQNDLPISYFAYIIRPINSQSINTSWKTVDILKNETVKKIVNLNLSSVIKKDIEQDFYPKLVNIKIWDLKTFKYHGFITIKDIKFEYIASNAWLK